MNMQERLAQRCNELEKRIAALETLEATMAHIFGWDGSAWRKLPLVFGYSDRWSENLGGTKSGDGDYGSDTTAVPAGYIYKVELISFRNSTGARGSLFFRINDGTTTWYFYRVDSLAIQFPTWLVVDLTLKEGDTIGVHQEDCLNNDVIQAVVWGYKMRVSE